MPYKIRTKLIIAFLGLVIFILSITGIIAYYNQSVLIKTIHKINDLIPEREKLSELRVTIERHLMYANDYLITGDVKEKEACHHLLAKTESLLKDMKASASQEKNIILGQVENGFKNMKQKSDEIFNLKEPIGSAIGMRLMIEMDAIYYNIIEANLSKYRNKIKNEIQDAVKAQRAVWFHSWIIIFIAAVFLIAIGVFFAFAYSRLFVKPIETIRNGADAIARGDFKTRLDVKTGDEIEQLSNAMNEMAAQIDSLYSNMQAMVDERTLELKESEERFKTIIETAKDAMICIEQAGVIYQWNKSAEEMFGWTANEAIGRGIHSLIVPERFREKANQGFKDFSQTGAGAIIGKTIEIIGLKKDGAEFPVELSISAVNIKGKWHAVGIIRDITERKETEKKLAEQMDFLKRFHKAAVQREFRIKELKDRVKELEDELRKKG